MMNTRAKVRIENNSQMSTDSKPKLEDPQPLIHKLQLDCDSPNIITTLNFPESQPHKKILIATSHGAAEKRAVKPQKQLSKPILLDLFNSIKQGPDNRLFNLLRREDIVAYQQVSQHDPQVQLNQIKCHCSKSQCLKMYCECFASGSMCSQLCSCLQCQNREKFKEEREKALKQLAKVPNTHMSCHCKKSRCRKKYCECFQNGRKCSEQCGCDGCENMETLENAEQLEKAADEQALPFKSQLDENSQSRFRSNFFGKVSYQNFALRQDSINFSNNSFGILHIGRPPTEFPAKDPSFSSFN